MFPKNKSVPFWRSPFGDRIGGWTGYYIVGFGLIGAIVAIPTLGITSTYSGIVVNRELESRTVNLPTTVLANTEKAFHFFFPYAPSPKYVELIYTDTDGEHSLILDTKALLDGLNLEQR